MENRDGEIHLDTDEARGASNSNVGRWVLGIGLLLAVIGMALAWMIPAMSHGPETLKSQNAQANLPTDSATQGSSTDSIVGENAGKLRDTADAPSGGPASDSGQPTVANTGSAR